MTEEEEAKELMKKCFLIVPQPFRTKEPEGLKGTKLEGLQFNDWDKDWTSEMVKKCALLCVNEILSMLYQAEEDCRLQDPMSWTVDRYKKIKEIIKLK